MYRFIIILFLLASLSTLAAIAAEGEMSGQELAIQIRDGVQVPVEKTTVTGTLKIRKSDGRRQQYRIRMRTIPGIGSWTNVYESLVLGEVESQRLTIIRSPGGENQYYLATAPNSETPFSEPKLLSNLNRTFSDSDFWVGDLGFDHLYWSEQTILEKDRRKTRECYVLESRKSGASGERVRTWVDVETGGPIFAEIYDPNGRKVREFTIGGIRRANGNSQISEIQMRSFESDSRTTLEFDPLDF